MSNLLHVGLYNLDPNASSELKGAIEALNFVRLVGEAGSPDQLADILHHGGVNLIFFHLDPKPASVVEVIDQISTRYPELALVAISHQTSPDSILLPMRAGCDQFVCEPIDASDLARAVSRVASKRLLTHPKSRCICITGAGGGAGTTSIACNLALEIGHVTDRDCALVDLDLQFGDIALNFDCEPKYNIHDLAVAGSELDRAVIGSTMVSLPCKVAILSRPDMIEHQESVTPETIHRIVEALMPSYENIVFDLPHYLNHASTTAMGLSDVVFIVCQLLVPSVRNAKRYFDALTRFGIPPERIEVVVNRSDGRNTGRVTTGDIEGAIKKPVFACIPNDYQFVARSIDFGRPIAALDRNSPVREAIRAIARKITSGPASPGDPKSDRRGFLSRLLAK